MSSPTARAADNKREEFRRYLERHGVMDVLTRALHTLYEEPDKPEDPVLYICNQLGRSFENQPTIDALQAELEEMRVEMQRLREELDNLRASSAGAVSAVDEANAESLPTVTCSGSTLTAVSVSANGVQDSNADTTFL